MNDSIIYLLKVSAGLGIVFIPYYFLIRYDPNLTVKRFLLLAGVASAWIFPFITFRRPDLLVNFTPIVFIDPLEGEILNPVSLNATGSEAGLTINWVQVLIITYLSGLGFMFLKNLAIILKWNHSFQKSSDGGGVAFTTGDQVFTLFSMIFIPHTLRDKSDLENILLHEKAHIQQLHFIDLMLMELTLLLTWFNPFSWLISRMIKENHEHLADRQVLMAGVNPARYKAQLLNHTLGVNVFRLGNQFNHSLTLKRFKMMKKPKTSRKGILKIAMLIPAILITLGLTTGMTPQHKPVKGKVVFADSGENAPGAAVVVAETSMGTVVDMDGTFMLNVDGDPELVISFVGYKTIRIKSSKISKKPLKLEPEAFRIDLKDVSTEAIQVKDKAIYVGNVDDLKPKPIFVLDGKVVEEIDHLDPETIKSINVIKDPDSELVKKYNAKNGLIMITSKGSETMLTPKQAKNLIDKNESHEVDGEVFYIVENMPMFPGGKAALKTYIYSKLEYPASAKAKGINGEVMVQFVVNAKGKIVNLGVIKSTHKEFEKPALEVFKGMPDWTPGAQRGKPVQVQVVVPVKFTADKG